MKERKKYGKTDLVGEINEMVEVVEVAAATVGATFGMKAVGFWAVQRRARVRIVMRLRRRLCCCIIFDAFGIFRDFSW